LETCVTALGESLSSRLISDIEWLCRYSVVQTLSWRSGKSIIESSTLNKFRMTLRMAACTAPASDSRSEPFATPFVETPTDIQHRLTRKSADLFSFPL
jgi:hypothetical protein